MVVAQQIHAGVVVVDHRPQLVDDRLGDLPDVVQTVQLAGQPAEQANLRQRLELRLASAARSPAGALRANRGRVAGGTILTPLLGRIQRASAADSSSVGFFASPGNAATPHDTVTGRTPGRARTRAHSRSAGALAARL